MKKSKILLCSVILVFLFTEIFAQNPGNKSSQTSVSLVSQTSNITVGFSVNSVNFIDVETPKGKAKIVRLDNGSPLLVKGAPDLSKLTTSVIIDNMAMYVAKVIDSAFTDYTNIEIAPGKGNLYRDVNPAKVAYEYGTEYNTDAFFPSNVVSLRQPYILRNKRGQTIVANMVQYNPVKKILRVYSNLVVELVVTKAPVVNGLQPIKNIGGTAEFDKIFSRQFLNYTTEKYTPIDETGTMLVICHPDYTEAMQPFVNWKNQRGLPTQLVEFSSQTTGTTASTLKTYVTNYYNSNNLSFLLLVGDSDKIPVLSKSGDSDVAYSYIQGSDSYPEFFVGRFSAQTVDHVNTQVERAIFYEKMLNTNDSWLNNAIGIASSEGGGGQGDDGESDQTHMNNIRTDLLNYGYSTVDQIYDPGASATAVANSLNAGRGVINYVGHGSDTYWVTSGFGVNNMASLTNVNKLPFIFDVACVNGNFVGQTCFAEGFMRSTSNGQPTGAATIIASTINQSWEPPMDGQDEMNDILVESYTNNIKRTFGGVAYNGCMHMNDEYGADGAEMTDTWTTFGDPSLLLRTSTPELMTVNHPAEILMGQNSFMVDCSFDGALATLSVNNQLVGSAVVSNGSANIAFTAFTEVAQCSIVVTAYNKVTYIGTVSVIPAEGPYISIQSFSIDDTNGNQNGEVENGETFAINLNLKNVGVETAQNVVATLSTTDTNFIISQNNFSFNNIDASATATGGNFEASVKNNLTNLYNAAFTVTITSGEKVWQKQFSIKVNAPELSVLNFSVVEDGTFGDGNGRIDPGEKGYINAEIINSGLNAAQNVEVNILTTNPYLEFAATDTIINTIDINQTANLQFLVTANSATVNGTVCNIELSVIGNQLIEFTDSITIGLKPQVEIGNGEIVITEYPFNNYYENNRSQMLFLSSEFSSGQQTITNLAFNFSRVTESESKRDLKNFTIKLGYTSQNAVENGYLSINNPVSVYSSDVFYIPEQTGWYTFDINSFDFNPQLGNLVIEIVWGDNGDYCASSDRTKLLATQTNFNSVAYGTNDSQTPPNFTNSSTNRPNVRFTFQSQQQQMSDVVFTVVDAANQLPLANAVITIGSLVLQTGSDGQVNYQLAYGQYNIIASLPLFFDYNTTITIDNSTTNITLPLVTIGNTSVVEVFVTDGQNPLTNTIVSAFGKQANTNNQGIAVFNTIPDGSYTINVQKSGYYLLDTTVNVDSDTLFNIVLTKIPVFTATFNISSNNVPLEGAQIDISTATGTTNSNGEYVFDNLYSTDNLAYTISKSGYYTVTDTFFVTRQNIVVNVAMVQIPDLTVNVSGYYGPVNVATVLFQNRVTATNEQGQAVFADVSTGSRLPVRVSKAGYYAAYDTVDVTLTNVEINVYLKKITDVVVTVSHADSLIEGASVKLNSLIRQTNQNGQAVFESVQSTNNAIITITNSGYLTKSDTINITFDDMLYTANITPIPDVKYTVLNSGAVVGNAKVTINNITLLTNEQGIVLFTDIYPGKWPVTIVKDGFYTVNDTVEVDTQNIEKNINLAFIPDVTVNVKHKGNPVSGAKVYLGNHYVVANTNGHALFTDITKGSYQLTVKKDNFVDYIGTFQVADTNTLANVNIELVTYKVEFTVACDGQVLAGAIVNINDTNIVANNNGIASINLPIADNYQYIVTHNGYYNNNGQLSVTNSNIERDINLVLITYNVTFNITGTIGNVSLANVTFNNNTKTTNTQGTVMFSGVAPKNGLTFIVEHSSFYTYNNNIDIYCDTTIDVNLRGLGITNNTNFNVTVYPNPAVNNIFINANSTLINNVVLYNTNGIIVSEYNNLSMQKIITIDTHVLKPGLYIIAVETNNGKFYKQVIIEK